MRDAAFIFGCLIRRGRPFTTLLPLLMVPAVSCLSPQLDSQIRELEVQAKQISDQRSILEGLLVESKGEFYTAIERYTRVIQSSASVATVAFAHVARGRVFARLGQFRRAREDLSEGIKLDPKAVINYVVRGNVYFDMGEYIQAFEDYNSAIRLGPQQALTYASRGAAYYQRNKFTLALQDLERAIQLDPKNARNYVERALIYGATNQDDLAFHDFKTAMQLDPNDPLARKRRGDFHVKRGEYDLAFKEFDSAIQVSPSYDLAYLSRGTARFHQAQFAEAAADLIRAVESRPANSLAIIWLYLSRSRGGNDGSLELQEMSKRLPPGHWYRIVVDFYLGRATQEAIYQFVMDTDPEIETDQRGKASFYMAQHAILNGKPPEAIRFFKAALNSASPTSIEYLGAREEVKRLTH